MTECIRVEYVIGEGISESDTSTLLPLSLIEECGSIHKAFQKQTGVSPRRIFHCVPNHIEIVIDNKPVKVLDRSRNDIAIWEGELWDCGLRKYKTVPVPVP